MIILALLSVFGLATWRMSSLLAREAGPWDIFLKIRELSGITHDDDKQVVMIPERFFAQMISCVWCNSIYIATFWMALQFISPIALYVAFPFAVSTLAILVDSRVFRN